MSHEGALHSGCKRKSAAIGVEVSDEPLSITISFTDSGKPYAPLAKTDPDVKMPLKEQKKAGSAFM